MRTKALPYLLAGLVLPILMTGCGIFGEVKRANAKEPPERARPDRTSLVNTPEAMVVARRAQQALVEGRAGDAERLLRQAKSEGIVSQHLMGLLAEAVLAQGDVQVFDQEFTGIGRAAAFLTSPRVRAAAVKAISEGDAASCYIMLDTLLRALPRVPRDRAAEVFAPFVKPLGDLVGGDDRALAVLGIEALASLRFPEARARLIELAKGGDPVLSRLARNALPASGRVAPR